jgi:hypothetical protein
MIWRIEIFSYWLQVTMKFTFPRVKAFEIDLI